MQSNVLIMNKTDLSQSCPNCGEENPTVRMYTMSDGTFPHEETECCGVWLDENLNIIHNPNDN